jgi:hypothetical protein
MAPKELVATGGVAAAAADAAVYFYTPSDPIKFLLMAAVPAAVTGVTFFGHRFWQEYDQEREVRRAEQKAAKAKTKFRVDFPATEQAKILVVTDRHRAWQDAKKERNRIGRELKRTDKNRKNITKIREKAEAEFQRVEALCYREYKNAEADLLDYQSRASALGIACRFAYRDEKTQREFDSPPPFADDPDDTPRS